MHRKFQTLMLLAHPKRGIVKRSKGGPAKIALQPIRRPANTAPPLEEDPTYHNVLAPTKKQQGFIAAGAALSFRPLDIDPSCKPQDQKRRLVDWVESYTIELDRYTATSVGAELMLQQVQQGTAQLPAPNHLRLAAVCLLLERLTGVVGRYQQLLRTLSNEILDSLYMPVGEMPSEEYVAEHLASLGISPTNGIQRFLARKPYFEAYREAKTTRDALMLRMDQLHDSVRKHSSLIEVSVNSWQKILLRYCFNAWHGAAVREKQQLRTLNVYLQRVVRRDTLQTHFYAWRTAAQEEKATRMRSNITEGVDLVVQKELHTNARLQEVQDNLEEVSLVVVRLKEEKQQHMEKLHNYEKNMETSMVRCDAWRDLAARSANFVVSLRDSLVHLNEMTKEEQLACAELSVKVVLKWVVSTISHIPQGAKVHCTNFGSDLKDGRVFIILLHVLSKGALSLAASLEHKDAKRRAEIALEAAGNLGLRLPFDPAELVGGRSDAPFLFLFFLWWHFTSTPTPNEELVVGAPFSNFRDDIAKTQSFLDQCRAFYPQWLEDRNNLQQYAMYLMMCRANGKSAAVVTDAETKELEYDFSLFAVRYTSRIPDVFVSCVGSSADLLRSKNENMRTLVNEVVTKHLRLLRTAFEAYAKCVITDDKKRGKKQGKNQSTKITTPQVTTDMDFTGWYRFCHDCRIITTLERDAVLSSGGTGEGGTAGKGGKKAAPARPVSGETPTTASGAAPRQPRCLTKGLCYTIFRDVVSRFRELGSKVGSMSLDAVSGLSTESKMHPGEWVAGLLSVAVYRYSEPIDATSHEPAAADFCLEEFIKNDIAACTSSASLPFRAAWSSAAVQSIMQKRRALLSSLFLSFASSGDSEGTMTQQEWLAALGACNVITPLITSEVAVQIFQQFQLGSGDGPLGEFVPEAAAEGSTSLNESARPPAQMYMRSEPLIVYEEFEEGLANFCVYCDPAPFVPLATKLQKYLNDLSVVAAEVVKREEERRIAEAEENLRIRRERERREAMEKELEIR